MACYRKESSGYPEDYLSKVALEWHSFIGSEPLTCEEFDQAMVAETSSMQARSR